MNHLAGSLVSADVAAGAGEDRAPGRCPTANRYSTISPSQYSGAETSTSARAHARAVQPRAGAPRRDDARRRGRSTSHSTAPPITSESVAGRRFEDQFFDRRVAVVAVAEVEVQEDVLHVQPELRRQRFVQAEVVADLGDDLRALQAPGPQLRRVGRRQHAEHHEQQRRDDDQQHDAPQQPADDVAGHRLSSTSPGARIGAMARCARRRTHEAAGTARPLGPQPAARYFSDVYE